jgi:4-alpha-glucanotransferase
MDGQDDVRLAGPGQVVTVEVTSGAGIGGWDIRPVRHALGAVLRRRPEAYHQTLRDHEAALADAASASPSTTVAPASIHDIVTIKETGLAAQLHYDPYERRSGLVRLLPTDTTPTAWATGRAIELGDAVDGAFEIDALEPGRLLTSRSASVSTGPGRIPIRVVKELRLGGDRRAPTLELEVTLENRSEQRLDVLLGLEWTLTMLGGGGNPSAWWDVDGRRTGHDRQGTATDVSELAQGNDHVGIAVSTTVSRPATAWWAPVETVSNSEGGFERVYQGAGLLLSWPVALAAGASTTVTVAHSVATARDRLLDETGAPAPVTIGA